VHHDAVPSLSQIWLSAHCDSICHDPYATLPLQSALVPLQNCCTGRRRASDPQLVPLHPNSVHVAHG